MRYLAIIGGLSLAACASHPPVETNAANGSLRTASATPNFVQVQQDSAVRQAIKTGYRARGIDGDKLYCREQTRIGSHFTDTACFTPDQLVQLMAVQSELQDMLNVPERCSGGLMCNGRAASGGKP